MELDDMGLLLIISIVAYVGILFGIGQHYVLPEADRDLIVRMAWDTHMVSDYYCQSISSQLTGYGLEQTMQHGLVGPLRPENEPTLYCRHLNGTFMNYKLQVRP